MKVFTKSIIEIRNIPTKYSYEQVKNMFEPFGSIKDFIFGFSKE
jgi:RNA recognition motif-containing protein